MKYTQKIAGRVLDIFTSVSVFNTALATVCLWAQTISTAQSVFILGITGTKIIPDQSTDANNLVKNEHWRIQKLVFQLTLNFLVLHMVNELVKKNAQKKNYKYNHTPAVLVVCCVVSTYLIQTIVGNFIHGLNR
jgi:hypothetical protein